MQPVLNGQTSFYDNLLTHLPTVPSVSQFLPEEDQNDFELIVSVDTKPEMFFVGKGNGHSCFTDLNEAILYLAELKLQQEPTATTSEPLTGFLTDSDRARVLELLQSPGKKLTEQSPVLLDNAELVSILDQEFPGAIWPADKLAIAAAPQMKEYLERRVAIHRKQSTPTALQQKARQIKNSLYYELKYGNAVSRMTVVEKEAAQAALTAKRKAA